MEYKRIVRHEILKSAKLTCLAFSILTMLQILPVFPSILLTWAWVVASFVIIGSSVSDINFYADIKGKAINHLRCGTNMMLLALEWLTTIGLFQYLKIPLFPHKDKEMIEVAIPGVETRLLSSQIFDDNGVIFGISLLLFTHSFSVATLVSFIRLGMILVEVTLAYLKKVSGKGLCNSKWDSSSVSNNEFKIDDKSD